LNRRVRAAVLVRTRTAQASVGGSKDRHLNDHKKCWAAEGAAKKEPQAMINKQGTKQLSTCASDDNTRPGENRGRCGACKKTPARKRIPSDVESMPMGKAEGERFLRPTLDAPWERPAPGR